MFGGAIQEFLSRCPLDPAGRSALDQLVEDVTAVATQQLASDAHELKTLVPATAGTALMPENHLSDPPVRRSDTAQDVDSMDTILSQAGRYGEIMVGSYQDLGLLGEGGMGEVRRAYDPRLDQIVAMKILPTHRGAALGRRGR